jgi:hypothetical protein
MMPSSCTPGLVAQIVDNQTESGWEHGEDIAFLRAWGELLIRELGMKVKDGHFLGLPLIKVETLNIKTLGQYNPAADGCGICGTILLNEKRLPGLDPITKVTLLVMLLFRAWQHEWCTDAIFEDECRARMREAGLSIAKMGVTIKEGGRFQRLLEENRRLLTQDETGDIKIPVGKLLFPKPEVVGKSTNQLWSCKCQKVRVGTENFAAVCLQCGYAFRRGDHVGKRYFETRRHFINHILDIVRFLRYAMAEACQTG